MHSADTGSTAKLIGHVGEWKELTTMVGNKMAVVWLVTDVGETRVWVFPSLYREVKDLLASGSVLLVEGDWQQLDGVTQLLAMRVTGWDDDSTM